MNEADFNKGLAEHHAARRDAQALALNVLTGDIEASLDLIVPMRTSEHIALISSLATDLAIALRRIHGDREATITHLRVELHRLAERPGL